MIVEFSSCLSNIPCTSSKFTKGVFDALLLPSKDCVYIIYAGHLFPFLFQNVLDVVKHYLCKRLQCRFSLDWTPFVLLYINLLVQLEKLNCMSDDIVQGVSTLNCFFVFFLLFFQVLNVGAVWLKLQVDFNIGVILTKIFESVRHLFALWYGIRIRIRLFILTLRFLVQFVYCSFQVGVRASPSHAPNSIGRSVVEWPS